MSEGKTHLGDFVAVVIEVLVWPDAMQAKDAARCNVDPATCSISHEGAAPVSENQLPLAARLQNACTNCYFGICPMLTVLLVSTLQRPSTTLAYSLDCYCGP